MNNKASLKYRGFSILEVIVSMLILALIMGGLVNVFIATKRHALHGRSRMASGELFRYFLDDLQKEVRQDQWGSNCLSADGDDTNCTVSSQGIDDITYTPQYEKSLAPGTTGLRKVKVKITWTEPSP